MKRIIVMMMCLIMVVGLSACNVKPKGASLMVESGKTVKFDYTLTVDGKVVDTSEGKTPLEYVHGEGKIIPGLAKRIEGMKVGESKTIIVPAIEAYGEVNPQAFREMPKSEIPSDTPIVVGQALMAKDESGRTFPLTIAEIKEETVILNFNHPLAGKELKFDIKIVEIK